MSASTPATLPDGLAGLLVASPANPTGPMLDRTALGGLIGIARARGIAEAGARALALEGFFGTLVAKSAGAELSEEFRERIARLDPPPQ